MKALRNHICKNFLSLLILGLFAMKFCAYSISAFRSTTSIYTFEKSSEETKDNEESFNKIKKKLLLYEPFLPVNQIMALENNKAKKESGFGFHPCSFPSRNVPTPPPDQGL